MLIKSSFSDFKQVKAKGGRSSVGLPIESWTEMGVLFVLDEGDDGMSISVCNYVQWCRGVADDNGSAKDGRECWTSKGKHVFGFTLHHCSKL